MSSDRNWPAGPVNSLDDLRYRTGELTSVEVTAMQASTSSPRIELYSGRVGGETARLVWINVVMMVVLVPVVSLITGLWIPLVASRVAGIIAGVAVFLLLECIALLGILQTRRTAAWLEGSILVIRGASGTRRCDLARASRISLESGKKGVTSASTTGIPGLTDRRARLAVRDGSEKKPLRLWLVNPRNMKPLEGFKLTALASAIESGGQWPGRDMGAVQHAAAGLRARAAYLDNGR